MRGEGIIRNRHVRDLGVLVSRALAGPTFVRHRRDLTVRSGGTMALTTDSSANPPASPPAQAASTTVVTSFAERNCKISVLMAESGGGSPGPRRAGAAMKAKLRSGRARRRRDRTASRSSSPSGGIGAQVQVTRLLDPVRDEPVPEIVDLRLAERDDVLGSVRCHLGPFDWLSYFSSRLVRSTSASRVRKRDPVGRITQ